ncbi:DUF2161 family putative PD-(D/E)XK-type phosphodiesterase [Geminicoccus sp.]|uniref:DUF2161 family putative PD-(D/E)XK-type phosphodiesterase n=1 Tax=Geminicoccus sp. TaxID=2024832 RepID=UPI0039C8881A
MAEGARRPRELKPAVPDALSILRRNVYGWFVRSSGVYALTEARRAALLQWPEAAQVRQRAKA